MKPQYVFWDQAANEKHFQDPFYLEQLAPLINQHSHIIEYGCGYGRILNILSDKGYTNTTGFDFSQGMIQRGKQQFPNLKLQHIEHAVLPLPDNSVDCAILSTVLTCIAGKVEARQVIDELRRVLKPNAPLYFTDFLITPTEHMQKKYEKDFASHKDWGVYLTTEGAHVRHYAPEHIAELTNQLHAHWYREEEFVTMNGNPVKTFHGIYLNSHGAM
jgi:ubiquinone/menaquinone biosynthesis C-methylase UbiE